MHPQEPPAFSDDALPPSLETAGQAMPLFLAADLQDSLMMAGNDLDRLQRLLDDACQTLMVHFYGATNVLRSLDEQPDADPAAQRRAIDRALGHLAGVITAMQFQDMSTQLIAHTGKRLRQCADRIACDAMADDEDGVGLVDPNPIRPNPVTQDEVDAGSVELF